MKKKRIKIKKYLRDRLYKLYDQGHGLSKHAIKDEHNASPYIHSHNTYQTYLQQCDRFSEWCMENGYRYPKDAREHIADYIDGLIKQNKSPYTISTVLCAICKAFELSTTDINVDIPKRRRQDIVRSRRPVASDKHISPKKWGDLITFCQCFGLRHDKELKMIRGSDLYEKNGELWCHIKSGKGGKPREVKFYGDIDELKTCKHLADIAGDGIIFPKTPKGLDVHSYRAVYASRVYHAQARDLESLPRNSKYSCRREKRGDVYDRDALTEVSQMLGHNRVDVVVTNYSHMF